MTFIEGFVKADPGDPFASAVDLLILPALDNYIATVFFAGRPVLTVEAGMMQGDDRQWEIEHVVPIEPPSQQSYVAFLQLIGELTDGEYAQLGSGDVLENPIIRVAEGEHIENFIEDYDCQGYELGAFVGTVASAMHAAFPDDLPEPAGF